MHINIRSAVNKPPDLSDFVSSNALAETWHNPLIDDKLLHINNFLVREDRETRGGRIAIYIPSHLKYCKIGIPSHDSVGLGYPIVELSIKSTSITLGAFYKFSHIAYSCFSILDDIFSFLVLENYSYSSDQFLFKPGDVATIEILVSNLKPNCAGVDCITGKMLQFGSTWFSKPLTHIINLAFEEGRVPKLWNSSLVKPIPKKKHLFL